LAEKIHWGMIGRGMGKKSLQSYSSAEHSSANLSPAFLPALSIIVLLAACRAVRFAPFRGH
jgi:hypothetical protein